MPDSGGIARQAKKIYIPVDGVARKVKKIYVGDAENKARLAFSSEYVWKKYVSKKVRTSVLYSNCTSEFVDINGISLWPTPSSDFFTEMSDGSGHWTRVGTSWNYFTSSGTFSLNSSEIIYTSKNVSFSNYDVKTKFGGKWILNNAATKAYKINGDTSTSDTLHIEGQEYKKAGSAYNVYTYSYEYKGDVTSENENAYTSGTVSNYTSTSGNDIRTVYIRKD